MEGAPAVGQGSCSGRACEVGFVAWSGKQSGARGSGGVMEAFSRLRAGAGGYVALDIGSSSIKLLEVRGPADRPEIVRAGIAPLAPGALQNNAVEDVPAVSDAIRRLVEELGVRSKRVVTAVPGPSVIINKARVELSPDEDLDSLLMIEADHFIPENIENVSLDYQVLSHEEEAVEVLLVTVRRDILGGFTQAIGDAGLEPSIVDVDYFALENMFGLNYDLAPDEVVALINVGARYSSINLVRGGVSTTTGDVQAGGSEVTDNLVARLGLSYEDAERVQAGESLGGDIDRRVREALQGSVSELGDAIHQSLRFLCRTASDDPLRAVFVSGGGAHVPGLLEDLSTRLEVPVEMADPFARVDIHPSLDAAALGEMAPSLGIAVGLGTRRAGDG